MADKKDGMKYETVPVKKPAPDLERKFKLKAAKELSGFTLQGIVLMKMVCAVWNVFATIVKFIAKHTWKFSKKHKVALLIISNVVFIALYLLPFLPDVIMTLITKLN